MLINIPQVSQPDSFRDRVNRQDQTLILFGMTWDDFEQLISNVITFYQLKNNNYQVIAKSKYLSNLKSSNLIKYINRGLTESPLTIEAEFIRQLDK